MTQILKPTDAMIEAGKAAWIAGLGGSFPTVLTAIYTAMESARDPDELREALEATERVVLEQRCERGTIWDLACTTIAAKVREHIDTALSRNVGDAP